MICLYNFKIIIVIYCNQPGFQKKNCKVFKNLGLIINRVLYLKYNMKICYVLNSFDILFLYFVQNNIKSQNIQTHTHINNIYIK